MKKLTKQEENIIYELLDNANDESVTQNILETIGRENWSRAILSSTDKNHLTREQLKLYHSMGGGYSAEEVSEHLYEWEIEEAIAEALENKGVSVLLYENRDYLAALREGIEIFEGIDVEQIKQNIMEER